MIKIKIYLVDLNFSEIGIFILIIVLNSMFRNYYCSNRNFFYYLKASKVI